MHGRKAPGRELGDREMSNKKWLTCTLEKQREEQGKNRTMYLLVGNYVLVSRICWKKSRIVSGFRSYLQTRSGPAGHRTTRTPTLSISPREVVQWTRGAGKKGCWFLSSHPRYFLSFFLHRLKKMTTETHGHPRTESLSKRLQDIS